jgi:membrane-bound lytic murein transglycosylase MltF
VRLAQAFEVFDEIVRAGLEATIHARWLNADKMDFAITLSLADRTQEQLATLAALVEQYDLELDVDDHRLASLK